MKNSDYRSIVTDDTGHRLTITQTPTYQIYLLYGVFGLGAAALAGDAIINGPSHMSKDAVEFAYALPFFAAVILYFYDARGNFLFDKNQNRVTYKKSGFLKKTEAGEFAIDQIRGVDTQYLSLSPGNGVNYLVMYKLTFELDGGRTVFVKLAGRRPNIIYDLLALSKFLKIHVSLPWKEPDGSRRVI